MSSDDLVSRKIQLTGGSTYTVSLPKEWAARNDVAPGDEVRLHPYRNGSLVVSVGDGADGDGPRTLDGRAPTDAAALDRLLAALYRTGAAGATVPVPEDATARRVAGDVARDLVGFEVVPDDDADAVTARDVLREDGGALSASLLQLHHRVLSMHRDAVDAVRGVVDPARIERRESEVARESVRLERRVQRALADLDALATLDCTRPAALDRSVVARQLRRVGDQAVRVADAGRAAATPPPDPLDDDFAAVARRSRDLVERAVDAAVGSADPADAHAVLDDRPDVADAVADLGDRLCATDDPDYALVRAVDALDRTADCAAVVARRALDEAVREG